MVRIFSLIGLNYIYFMFQKVCHDVLCFSGTLHEIGTCASEDVCYEVFIKASPVKGNLSINDAIRNERSYIRYIDIFVDKIREIQRRILQLNLYYHASGLVYVEYFLLYLIVNDASGYLQDQVDKGLLLRDKIIGVRPPGYRKDDFYAYDFYALNVMSYNVSFGEEVDLRHAPSLNADNGIDELHTVQNFTFGSCISPVVIFNKVRLCPYLEVPLNSYPLSVKIGNLVLKDNSTNAKREHVFELLEWEYMIKGDQLLICVSDMIRLLSFLPNPERNVASPVLQRFGLVFYICIIIISEIL